MRNCVILGAGRSGTSTAAGMLAAAGYNVGRDLVQATAANPKGFFEDREVNRINEALLARVMPSRPPLIGRWLFRKRPGFRQRWLGRLPLEARVVASADLKRRMSAVIPAQPFCLKDPRLCYTLDAWREVLPTCRFLCIFRDPPITAQSMVKERRRATYLRDLDFTIDDAFGVWSDMYSHVLHHHAETGEWLFLHHDQLFDDPVLDSLNAFLDASVDRSFPDRALQRTEWTGERGPKAVMRLYDELCARAGYTPQQREAGA